ncbi:probable glucan endo-1,3-beta-glucosidase A6 [Henckelia pumila]|uniref:probable glucan endo-1,3-beta-glucosidase A6 n=1 Tax=Henckelia pumila TaxID=405737 RepID=UPI003C6E8B52
MDEVSIPGNYCRIWVTTWKLHVSIPFYIGNNLPSPSESIKLVQKLNGKRIKIYGANPKTLQDIQNTDIQISIMVPNDLIHDISTNQTLADEWVRLNVVPFYPKSKIRYLLVGNEILSNSPNTIRYSMRKFGLKKIKVGTPLAMDALESSFPPSNGTFRFDVREKVIKPLLHFLDRSKSFFFVDAYNYFAWVGQPLQINLESTVISGRLGLGFERVVRARG